MKETIPVVENLFYDMKREKEVSPSLRDRLRYLVNALRTFINSVFGIQIPEIEYLRSVTLTNLYNSKIEAYKLEQMISNNFKETAKPGTHRTTI
jgi:hypothetical protein